MYFYSPDLPSPASPEPRRPDASRLRRALRAGAPRPALRRRLPAWLRASGPGLQGVRGPRDLDRGEQGAQMRRWEFAQKKKEVTQRATANGSSQPFLGIKEEIQNKNGYAVIQRDMRCNAVPQIGVWRAWN